MLLRGLYAITDEILTPHETILEQVETALKGGIAILQYRNKTMSDNEVEPVCIELHRLCRTFGVPFVIDDRPHLAQKIGAEGLHIGKEDISLPEARKIFTRGIIGVSCYGSIRKALQVQNDGANYVAFGSFFPSPTKPHSGIVSMKVLHRAKTALRIPICAIGGINGYNLPSIAQHKPDMICILSALWKGDIERNLAHLKQGIYS